MNYELILGAWGAILSTALAVWEVRKTKVRLDVIHSFTTCHERGNEIAVYNASNNPVTINSFELQFFDKSRFGWKLARTEHFPEAEGFLNIKIEPHSRYDLTFTEQDHFNWGKQKICILFHIAGRDKSVSKAVYTP